MSDRMIRDLLHDAADGVEPGDRLDAIRAATSRGRRTPTGWWVAGGVGLVAASVVTALALTTGGTPRVEQPGPADRPTTAAPDTPTNEPVAVYFVGDSADGARLYREFRPDVDPDSRVVVAIGSALRGDALDPDYRSPWPEGVTLTQWIPRQDRITVILEGAPAGRPPDLSEEDARLALEQLVRTAQALEGRGKVPVDVQVEQEVTDTILGVPTTEPLTGSRDRDVLAPVSLSDPPEGLEVDNDELFTVRGRGTSADRSVQVLLKRWEGTAVLADRTIRDAVGSDRLTGFGESFDLSEVAPGDYDVIATVRNADGTVDSDTRRITIVE